MTIGTQQIGPTHQPETFATFRVHTVNATTGAVDSRPTTGGAQCPVRASNTPSPSLCLRGLTLAPRWLWANHQVLQQVNCTVSDYIDAAAAVVVPASESPSGRATLFFAFSCMCEIREPKAHTVENVWAAPTLAALDLGTLQVRKVGDTPQDTFNTEVQDWPAVGWVRKSETGSDGRLLVSANHATPTTTLGRPNLTLTYLQLDPVNGSVVEQFDSFTRCEGCGEQGLMPEPGYGLSAPPFFVRPFDAISNGKSEFPGHVVAIRAATGAVAVHLRSAIDWLSWAVESKTGDIVGLGSCLCVQGQSGCPQECVFGGLLFLRWGEDLSKPPRVLSSVQITDIGGGAGYHPRLVTAGGALIQSTGVFSQLIMKRPDVPSCTTPLEDRRPCSPLPRGTPTPTTNASCAAVVWCCWGTMPGADEACFQETDGPGPPVFVPGIASFDAASGKWLRTVDLLNLSDEPMVEVSEQSFQLLEVPQLPREEL